MEKKKENEEFEKIESQVTNSTLQLRSAYHEADHALNGVFGHLEEIMDHYGYLQQFVLGNLPDIKIEQIRAEINEWNQEPPQDFEFCYPLG